MSHAGATSQIRVLGPVEVVAHDGPRDPGGEISRLLLALLVVHHDQVVSYDRLTSGLWGETPPPTARKTLQVHVSNLRRRLDGLVAIETTPAGYRLDSSGVTIDAVQFESDLDAAVAGLPGRPDRAVAALESALGRWRGPAYADLCERDALQPEIARLEELRLQCEERRIDTELARGRHDRVVADTAALAEQWPYRERLQALRILALYRCGRQTDALRRYEHTRRVLAEELGLVPSDELRDLHRRVLEHSPELELRPVPPPDRDDVEAIARARGYVLGEALGRRARGGIVYRATQPALGREVAVEVRDSPVATAPLLARHDHPHLVTILDAWREGGHLLVVMPLLRGTLGQVDAAGELEPAGVLSVVADIGDALQHLHDQGVTHGAVSPDNVLLDDHGHAYLTDALDRGHGGSDGGTRDDERDGRLDDLVALAALAGEMWPSDGTPTDAAVSAAIRHAMAPDCPFADVRSFVEACGTP